VHIHVQPTPQREDEERENHETRLELSSYGFDFVHCREEENILPDTLFKATCTVTKEDSLFKLHHVTLIKTTQLFERINIDFKGPLPSNNGNKYFLNIVGKYSRFPFVFPCSDVSTTTVIKCLTILFVLFGMPAYVHSEGSLGEKGIASSQTASNNGQVERYNGVVWKAVEMSLKSKNLHVKYWQDILPDVLHSIQSLLCSETKETLHGCFF